LINYLTKDFIPSTILF